MDTTTISLENKFNVHDSLSQRELNSTEDSPHSSCSSSGSVDYLNKLESYDYISLHSDPYIKSCTASNDNIDEQFNSSYITCENLSAPLDEENRHSHHGLIKFNNKFKNKDILDYEDYFSVTGNNDSVRKRSKVSNNDHSAFIGFAYLYNNSADQEIICSRPSSALDESVAEQTNIGNEYYSSDFNITEDSLYHYPDLVASEEISLRPEVILQQAYAKSMPSIGRPYSAFEEILNNPEVLDVQPHFIVSDTDLDYKGASSSSSCLSNSAIGEGKFNSVSMGVENTWNEDKCFSVPSGAIPMPAPPTSNDFDDYTNCNTFDNTENGPYPPNLDVLFSTAETETDVSDVTAEMGVCGLRNLGNTCFMGAGLQCLAATKSLVCFFLNKFSTNDMNPDCLTVEFAQVVQKIWSGQYSVVHPFKFKQALGELCPQFKDSSQHDCQEFLALLLDALHQQLLNFKKNLEENDVSKYNIDKELFKKCTNSDSVSMDVIPSIIVTTVNGNNEQPLANYPVKSNNCDVAMELCSKNDFKNNKNCNKEKELQKKVLLQVVCPKSCDFVQNSEALENKMCNNNSSSSSSSSSIRSNLKFDLDDIVKDAKTSNINVLAKDEEPVNNELRFDSDKFPKPERRQNGLSPPPNVFHLYENNTNGKRGKSSTVTTFRSDFHDGFTQKKIKTNDLNNKNANAIKQPEKNIRMENERKMKILNVSTAITTVAATTTAVATNGVEPVVLPAGDYSKLSEDSLSSDDVDESPVKNVMDCQYNGDDDVDGEEEEEDEAEELSIPNSETESLLSDKDDNIDLDGDNHWEKVTMKNQSVIFDSFQGQFQNTVVCSICNFKSVTYEPFMYLSVPLPHAIEKQLCVTFVPANPKTPVQYLLTLSKQDTVAKVKSRIIELLDVEVTYGLVVAEVLDNHIAKILDDNSLVRYINDVSRKIYVFEQMAVEVSTDTEPSEPIEINCADKILPVESINAVSKPCCICLENKYSEIFEHRECRCVLCSGCIGDSCAHYRNNQFKCPVCRKEITLNDDMIPIGTTETVKCNIRMLNIPVVFRVDETEDENNKKKVQLVGHPALLKIPNEINTSKLYEVIEKINPYKQDFKLLLVDGQGIRCSRCAYNKHCHGCEIPKCVAASLSTDDVIAVSFSESVEEIRDILHSSMASLRLRNTLSLNDCVQAFCQSEILDEYNPWYCPQCEKNQCATKTLSVRRFPNYLIVYLKRFVFHECVSIKLEDKVVFPLHGFNVNKKNKSPYDLYACVCHSGGVSVGHYIAYTQHPYTNEWHCFNDENVSKQMPMEDEYENAYILFYKKRDAPEIVSGGKDVA